MRSVLHLWVRVGVVAAAHVERRPLEQLPAELIELDLQALVRTRLAQLADAREALARKEGRRCLRLRAAADLAEVQLLKDDQHELLDGRVVGQRELSGWSGGWRGRDELDAVGRGAGADEKHHGYARGFNHKVWVLNLNKEKYA